MSTRLREMSIMKRMKTFRVVLFFIRHFHVLDRMLSPSSSSSVLSSWCFTIFGQINLRQHAHTQLKSNEWKCPDKSHHVACGVRGIVSVSTEEKINIKRIHNESFESRMSWLIVGFGMALNMCGHTFVPEWKRAKWNDRILGVFSLVAIALRWPRSDWIRLPSRTIELTFVAFCYRTQSE